MRSKFIMRSRFILLAGLFLIQNVFAQEFNLGFKDSLKTLEIDSDGMILNSSWWSPVMDPAIDDKEWKFINRTVVPDSLSGIPGTRTTDLFRASGIEIEREVWIAEKKHVVAVRQKVINSGSKSIRLQSMTPLACATSADFQLIKNPDPSRWHILVQKRLKNERPETVIPEETTRIIADPFFYTSLGPELNGPGLLIGYLNVTDHLAHMDLSFGSENDHLQIEGLYARCEFNNVAVPPDGSRNTQWVYISTGQNPEYTIKQYADRVANFYHLPAPSGNAPSVYCSWYWYGADYNEDYLHRDLDAFRDHHMPFDVFLIDESWGLSKWGDFEANDRFPLGMKDAADRIRDLGYIPGIWTCPYLVSPGSELAEKNPAWLLMEPDGDHYTFRMNDTVHWVLDLTYPGVLEYLEKSYRKISEEWGYRYFKFDFMRSVILDGDYQLYDPEINRLEAYRMGLEAIRRGVGKTAYISVCGGHYGGSLGLADSQRSGSDVVSYWDTSELPKYRQNILRTWMSRLWHVDPDAMMVRRNEMADPAFSRPKLTLGKFTDKEAEVNALNQYIGGGLVTFTEEFTSIDNERRALYRHVIPSVNSSSFPVDWYNPEIPSMMVTGIKPFCSSLESWNTLAIVNWSEERAPVSFALNDLVLKSLPGDRFLLFEFFSQRAKGIFRKGDFVKLESLEPHSGMLIKIIPWNGTQPVLAGTNLHFSMGGVEIKEWNTDTYNVSGLLETKWEYPVNVTAVFPDGPDGYKVRTTTIPPSQERFRIEY